MIYLEYSNQPWYLFGALLPTLSRCHTTPHFTSLQTGQWQYSKNAPPLRGCPKQISGIGNHAFTGGPTPAQARNSRSAIIRLASSTRAARRYLTCRPRIKPPLLLGRKPTASQSLTTNIQSLNPRLQDRQGIRSKRLTRNA